MSRVVVNRELGKIVALRALPLVNSTARQIRDAAKVTAPDAGAWITARDDRVRHSHVEADSQTIPDNLRFALPKATGGSGTDMARAPRDPDLPPANRDGCRCVATAIVGAIAEKIVAGDAVVEGPRVRARVSVTFNRIAESEFPSEPDSGGGWFREAANTVAAASRNRVSRST